jgi:hypothetical protein
MQTKLFRIASAVSLCAAAGACAAPEIAPVGDLHYAAGAGPEATGIEGEARGFPALRNLKGERLADGDFTQWLAGDRLHQRIRYAFGSERFVEEESVIRQEPSLVQEHWSWVEVRGGEVERRFEVDFLSGEASAEKREDGELKRWSEQLDLLPGGAFAGAAWALALKSVRERLRGGEEIELQTVGFTPQPRAATVTVSYAGLDHLTMAGRTLAGDHFIIHPEIPLLVRAFVQVPDSQLWLASSPPAAFLRFEGPLAEPDDDLVRIDLLPGEPSAAAARAAP